MRKVTGAFVFVLPSLAVLGGCGLLTPVADYNGPLGWTQPSFDGPLQYGQLTKKVPLVEVERQVECEFKAFFEENFIKKDDAFGNNNSEENRFANDLLVFDQPANVILTLQTDLSGKVTATGVDLSKFDLNVLSNSIAFSGKAPSLQASFSPKQTVSAAPQFALPQTYYDVWSLYYRREGLMSKKIEGPQNFLLPIGAKIVPKSEAPLLRPNNEPIIELRLWHTPSPPSLNSDKDLRRFNEELEKLRNLQNEKKGTDDADVAGLSEQDKVLIVSTGQTADKPPKDISLTGPLIKGLGNVGPCDDANFFPHNLYVKNWLADFWKAEFGPYTAEKYYGIDGSVRVEEMSNLRKFLEPKNPKLINAHDTGNDSHNVACNNKLTLKSQIALVFDANAGVNSPIVQLLPVSGVAFDVSPDLQQSIEIDLLLQNSENQNLCDKLIARKPLGNSG